MHKPDSTLFALILLSVVNVIMLAAPVSGWAQAKPLPVAVKSPTVFEVRNVDNPALQPFQFVLGEEDEGQVYTVPAGKQLVIEYVSALAGASEECVSFRYELKTTVDGTAVEHYFFPQTISPPANGDRQFGLSQQTRIYADPNTTVEMNGDAEGTGTGCGAVIGEIRLSGHFVNVP